MSSSQDHPQSSSPPPPGFRPEFVPGKEEQWKVLAALYNYRPACAINYMILANTGYQLLCLQWTGKRGIVYASMIILPPLQIYLMSCQQSWGCHDNDIFEKTMKWYHVLHQDSAVTNLFVPCALQWLCKTGIKAVHTH